MVSSLIQSRLAVGTVATQRRLTLRFDIRAVAYVKRHEYVFPAVTSSQAGPRRTFFPLHPLRLPVDRLFDDRLESIRSIGASDEAKAGIDVA